MNLDLNCISCVLRMRPSPLPNLFLVDVMVNDFKPLDCFGPDGYTKTPND